MSEKPKRPAPMTKSPSVTAHFSPNKKTPFSDHLVQLQLSNMLSNNNMKALQKQKFENIKKGLTNIQTKTTGSIQKNTSNNCTKKNNKGSCAIQGGKRKTRKHKKSHKKTRRTKRH